MAENGLISMLKNEEEKGLCEKGRIFEKKEKRVKGGFRFFSCLKLP